MVVEFQMISYEIERRTSNWGQRWFCFSKLSGPEQVQNSSRRGESRWKLFPVRRRESAGGGWKWPKLGLVKRVLGDWETKESCAALGGGRQVDVERWGATRRVFFSVATHVFLPNFEKPGRCAGWCGKSVGQVAFAARWRDVALECVHGLIQDLSGLARVDFGAKMAAYRGPGGEVAVLAREDPRYRAARRDLADPSGELDPLIFFPQFVPDSALSSPSTRWIAANRSHRSSPTRPLRCQHSIPLNSPCW